MKITIEQMGDLGFDKFIYENPSDGLSLEELMPVLKGMLVSAGYHPTSVQRYFNDECNDWFPEEEVNIEEQEEAMSAEEMEIMSAETPTQDNRDDYYFRASLEKKRNS